MGDIADDCYDRALDEMHSSQYGEQDSYEYFSRYSRGSTQARQRRGYTEPANPPPTCNRCGKTDLKWRVNESGGWQLYETDQRGEHNECVPHQCEPTTADDFDDCSDLV